VPSKEVSSYILIIALHKHQNQHHIIIIIIIIIIIRNSCVRMRGSNKTKHLFSSTSTSIITAT
jgi:hypothetical protein